ncbi:ATP-binding protein [Actinocrispum sp. NPDC049592]|uniref:ATP-binding protein n=1 Tax=Actinocrispum sp. NPDC049592 TaxID=3154835 RepID=UPI00342EC047
MDTFAVRYDVELRLSRDPASVGAARELVRSTVTGPWLDDVVLVVSELVTNALLHGSGNPVLRLCGGGNRVRVEVQDTNPVLPEIRESGQDGGWGLPMVERLSKEWGASTVPGGKIVWCELVAAG